MFVLQDTSIEFKALESRLKVVAERLVSFIQPSAQNIKLGSSQKIFPSEPHRGVLYLVKEGVVSYAIHGNVLFHYESGELLGLEHLVAAHHAGAIATDFAVVVDSYAGDDLLNAARSDVEVARLLHEYLAGQAILMQLLMCMFLKQTAEVAPEIRAIAKGDEIFLEGTAASEVFTLVEGEAEAIVGGAAVGKVLPGELFGVVSALAGTTRGATVRATKNCTVLVIAKDNFSQLIESRPATVLRMVEEMAKTLVSSESAMSQISLSRF